MYVSFQKEAFLTLDADKKRIILENSKLKDEIALQSIGINNLSVRSTNDKNKFIKIEDEKRRIAANVTTSPFFLFSCECSC
jgi:hypothetical protein